MVASTGTASLLLRDQLKDQSQPTGSFQKRRKKKDQSLTEEQLLKHTLATSKLLSEFVLLTEKREK
jgi:hypothetical protein